MKKIPLTDKDFIILYANKLRSDNSLFLQQKKLIEGQLKSSKKLFSNMFGIEDFKNNARDYLKSRHMINKKNI